MRFLFFIIFIISNVNLAFSEISEKNEILAGARVYFFKYEDAFNILIKDYDKFKNNCQFIRNYNHYFSLSSEDFFNRIKESDILKEMSCDYGYYLPFGPIFYYFRKGELEKLKKFDEKIVRETLGEYIYFRYLKNDDFCNLYKSVYNKEEKIIFARPSAAYLFYICGDLEKAKKIASIRYNHFKKKIEKEGLFFRGEPNFIIESIIYSIIFDLRLKEKDIERYEMAKKYFPYIFELYEFK